MNVHTLEVNGKRIVQLPEQDYLALVRRAGIQSQDAAGLPPLPPLGRDGNYPALEYAGISLARKIIRDRKRLGLSQAELARQAGMAPESLNRLEHGKANATLHTIEKIEGALNAAEKRAVKAGATAQTLRLADKDFVIMERREYERLVGNCSDRCSGGLGVTGDVPLPAMPAKLPDGNYPALENLRAGLARKLIKRRWANQLSQAELAKRAGLRAETLNRIEKGKITPTVATIDKLDKALTNGPLKNNINEIR